MKQYLGDGVYVDFDSYGGLILTTEDGLRVTHRIVLEPEVYESLTAYVAWLKATAEPGRRADAQ